MLLNTKNLQGYAIRATDGDIGTVTDLYFDDQSWAVRFLVVEPGPWLVGKMVLISPRAVTASDSIDRALSVSLSKANVRDSPATESHKPVSVQHELSYIGYYGRPYYQGVADTGKPGAMLVGEGYGGTAVENSTSEPLAQDPHLRSAGDIARYGIEALDGDIGHLQALLVDDVTWDIRYLVVNTSNWWLGHEVLIAPQWIAGVRWHDSTVSVHLTRQSIKDAPPYHSGSAFGRNEESNLYRHHGFAGYWAGEVRQESPEFILKDKDPRHAHYDAR
ncbi:MAG: PRC-barrel domain-containing protein [Steroidobacteraceae bacterium]